MTLPSAIAPMAEHRRWVGWRWVTLPDGKRDKPPFRGDFPEFNASTTKPNSWVAFDTAVAAMVSGKLDGIGYVCADDASRVYVDLDDCRDPVTGEIAPWAQALVEECDSYTEITPSETGLRIIGEHGGALKAPIHAAYRLPGGGKGEVFFRAVRYITVTGNRLPGTPDRLADIAGPVLDLLMRAGKAKAAEPAPEFGAARSREDALAPIEDIRAALAVIANNDLHYDDWVRIGLATFSASSGTGEGFEAWQEWSAKSQKHQDAECLRVWRSFHKSPAKSIGFGSLVYQARAVNPLFVAPSWVVSTGERTATTTSGHTYDPETGEILAAATPPVVQQKQPLWCDDGAPDSDAVPIRPWVAVGYLMRGSVSVLSGQGAGGKSSLCVALTIALSTGRRLGGFEPVRPVRVVNYNVEDDQDEQRRRYLAALNAQGLNGADIAGRIMRCGPHDVGTLFVRHHDTGQIAATAAMQQLETLCAQDGVEVLICDPLAELHNAEENDNTAMRAVIAAFRAMAQRLGIAVLILHHDRKGNNTPGDMDRVRGASAISGAVRVMLTLSTMSGEEAEKFSIPSDQRRRHFRIDGAKSNYAPATEAEWWRLDGYQIPNGETVAAALPWAPPSAFSGVSMDTCIAILGRLARGEDGFAYAAKAQSKGSAVEMMTSPPFNLEPAKASAMLAVWKREGLISEAPSDSPNSRHKRQGYTVNETKFSEMRQHGGGE
jgi:hypothetical protein